MGEQNRNPRVPDVTNRGATYTWRNRPDAAVTYTRDSGFVTIASVDEKVKVPVHQVRWLAEVLLQVSDFNRETYVSDAHDDYTSPNLLDRDRR
jgi:hypothetical protein